MQYQVPTVYTKPDWGIALKLLNIESPHNKSHYCDHCGADTFHKASTARFCSDTCRYAYRNKRLKVLKKSSTKDSLQCIWCSASFIAINTRKVYCTQQCVNKARNARRRGSDAST